MSFLAYMMPNAESYSRELIGAILPRLSESCGASREIEEEKMEVDSDSDS